MNTLRPRLKFTAKVCFVTAHEKRAAGKVLTARVTAYKPLGFGQCTEANIIASGVATSGENSSTMRPWRQTKIRSETDRISGK